jgi:hypothetical protein
VQSTGTSLTWILDLEIDYTGVEDVLQIKHTVSSKPFTFDLSRVRLNKPAVGELTERFG